MLQFDEKVYLIKIDKVVYKYTYLESRQIAIKTNPLDNKMDVEEPTFVMRIKTVGERWENSALIN